MQAPKAIAQRDLSAAIYAIATGESAPSGTAMALCSEAKGILRTVIALLSTNSSALACSENVLPAIRSAAALINAAEILIDSEESR